METKDVSGDLFSRFAASDLVRWRALRGRTLSPVDERWGVGLVTDIRWEGRSDLPDDRGTIYVHVEYAGDLKVRVNSRAFARLHRSVRIEPGLADFVLRWFGEADPVEDEGEARAAAVAQCDSALRAEQDAERQLRVEELRRRVRERRATD